MNRLTMVHKNGIVNDYEISPVDSLSNNNLVQLIWNDKINFKIKGLNCKGSVIENPSSNANISNYRAIYLNGIMIVKNGKVYPKKSWWKF